MVGCRREYRLVCWIKRCGELVFYRKPFWSQLFDLAELSGTAVVAAEQEMGNHSSQTKEHS